MGSHSDKVWALHRQGVVPRGLVAAALAIREGFEDAAFSNEEPAAFCDWVDAMTVARLPCGPVLDVFADGKSIRQIERLNRRRAGSMTPQIIAGLVVFASLGNRNGP